MTRPGKRRAGTKLVPRAVREEQMLAVAADVFAERGFTASMDEIAERADISKPMLYAYFRSKEGLYSAVMARIGSQLLETMASAVDPALEPEPQVFASMTAFLGFVEEHRQGWAVLQREIAAGGGPMAEDVARVRAEIVRRMAMVLAPHLGDLRADAYAHGFVGAGESLATWWVGHPELTREDVAELIMDVGWRGVGDALGTLT